MTEAAGVSRILTLVFTDLADSTALKTQRGDQAVGELIARHRAHIRRLAGETGGRIIDWAGDGCFLTFEAPSAAVLFALRLQRAHGEEPDLPGVRTGIHMGEVSERPGPDGDMTHPRVEGLAVDLAARISALARPAQVLMSSPVTDSARHRLDSAEFGQAILWRTQGSYSLKGFDEAVEIREAGLEGFARFETPAASDKATPVLATGPGLMRKRTRRIAILAGVVLAIAVAVLLWTRASDRSSVLEGGGTQTTGSHTVPGFGGRPAIAVLPFENRSEDPKQAIFADGLAEDLITRLSTWRAFPVIGGGSSFHYRGDVDVRRVAKELAVQYVVQGSVRRADERIRVTAQLIDAQSGENVWNQTYDRQVQDVFELQDEISATIAASLVGDLTHAELGRAQQRGTRNLEAWSLYELGIQHFFRLKLKETVEARALFDQAVALEPKFATALAYLSATYSWEVQLGSGGSPQDKLTLAVETARRAVELDPRDPMAHVALAFAFNMSGDARNGLASAQRAVDLNPSSPMGWASLGWAKLMAGDPKGSIAANEQSIRLDPQGAMVPIAHEQLSESYWELGQFDAGLEEARTLVAALPDFPWGYMDVALNAVGLGRLDEARAAMAEARRIVPNLSQALIQQIMGVSRPEVDARRNAALTQVGLE